MSIQSMRPWKEARALRELFANPDGTQQVFEIIDAVQGPALVRVRRWLRQTARGRRLLAKRPNLIPLLSDRERLRALPKGSLGREYLAFSHYQTRNIGVGMIATMAWFKIGRVTDRNLGARGLILDGRRRARRSAWFLEVPWHEWLARPESPG